MRKHINKLVAFVIASAIVAGVTRLVQTRKTSALES